MGFLAAAVILVVAGYPWPAALLSTGPLVGASIGFVLNRDKDDEPRERETSSRNDT